MSDSQNNNCCKVTEKLKGKLNSCWLICYFAVVIMSILFFSCTIYHLTFQLKNEKNSNSQEVHNCLNFEQAVTLNNESKFLIDTSNSRSQGVLWLIGFLTLSILTLIFSMPICISSREKRLMQFCLDCTELKNKHNQELGKQRTERVVELIKRFKDVEGIHIAKDLIIDLIDKKPNDSGKQ
ncbi:MAG: hypothetical protein OXK80_00465 [Bdellovibrionales bacterium]|nr:hypothetical protein [Bdellovibrionales bacterium]